MRVENAHFILKCYCSNLYHLHIAIFLVLIQLNVNSCKDRQEIFSTVKIKFL